jgi:hypothetical protein
LIFVAFLIKPNDVSGAPGGSKGTAWDTVMANIQVIETMNEPDSVKNALMQQLFSDFQLTAEDYRRFYEDFLKRSPEKQAAFLKQVEEIILEWMNKDYKKTR